MIDFCIEGKITVVAQQLAIGSIYTAIETANDKENSNKDITVKLVSEPIGIFIATVADKSLNKAGTGALTKQILSNVVSSETKDQFEDKLKDKDNR